MILAVVKKSITQVMTRQIIECSLSLARDMSGFCSARHVRVLGWLQEERIVDNDNCVRYKGLSLQIPEQAHRRHFVKATVKVHEHPDGSLAVFHAPRCLARYDEKAALKEETAEKRAV